MHVPKCLIFKPLTNINTTCNVLLTNQFYAASLSRVLLVCLNRYGKRSVCFGVSPWRFRFADGFLLVHNVPRNVTRTLRVSNGGDFGEWGEADFCAEGSFAVGYDMKVNPFC